MAPNIGTGPKRDKLKRTSGTRCAFLIDVRVFSMQGSNISETVPRREPAEEAEMLGDVCGGLQKPGLAIKFVPVDALLLPWDEDDDAMATSHA